MKTDGSWILLYFLTNLVADLIFLLSILANLSYSLSLDAKYVSYYFIAVLSIYSSAEYFYSGAFILNFPDYVKPKFHLFTENSERIFLYLFRSGWKAFVAVLFSYFIFGGHPRPWNALRNECSRLIENFLNTLSDLNSKLALRWEAAFSLKDLSESTKMDILRKVDSKKSSLRDLEKLLAETNVFRLGNILCVAYTEDRLGVVQIDLPNVLGLFCDSYLQLEKFGRLSTTQYIDTSKRRLIDTSRVTLKTELIKSLRCIKSTYGENLWSVNASAQIF
uniref:Uncharacterized protein n=1 Tax=Romanomermis culicivorax TaxID=13658 RepID=A0A915KBK1_ROMCU